MRTITKVVINNFKKFKSLTLDFEPGKNVLVGNNEAGKSSVLLALDITLGGSRNRVETLGVHNLLNKEAVDAFLVDEKCLDELPKLTVDIFLEEADDESLYGTNNALQRNTDGLRMVIAPMEEYGEAIQAVLDDAHPNFPFEYYAVHFLTFAGRPYAAFNRPIKHLMLDSARIDGNYAAREYTRAVYNFNAPVEDRYKLENLYRQGKQDFTARHLSGLNEELPDYQFNVKSSVLSNLETDLIITENDIPLENHGKGRQCFIKTEFALGKHKQGGLEVMLLEEPENHLSHTSMKALVNKLAENQSTQLFIATHSSHICSRLDLRHVLLIGPKAAAAALKRLSDETAEFFMKAPDNNVLEFTLSSKVILVEGDAEFILVEEFYKQCCQGRLPQADNVHVIAIGGTSFKRYMELANLLGIRVASIRDNDKNYQKNCIENYVGFVSENAKIFADPDNDRSTFEIGLHDDNTETCKALFGPGRKTLSPLEYMLANKAEAAFELLKHKPGELTVPAYIAEAIQWINE
ncbi:ATP-dependent nuclease [Vreelandella profundi]|uniref:ATP-dependent nuclease n=1 Tax=Vreelandella profundi TaxID=2852117 RepID=UPI001F210C4F|nr:AAA family ATPase [Halomonas profundi]